MAKANPETIILKGNPHIKERRAGAALSPGNFVELTTANTVRKTSTAGESGSNIAIENDLVGETITDAYASGDRVLYASFASGDEAYVRVAANQAAIALGADLSLTNEGTVATHTGTHAVVARALEAVNNSSGGSEVFIRVEIA